MLRDSPRRALRGQTKQEIILVIVVVAIALIAALSVFVPALRAFWLRIGHALLG
jgi:Flp pilus assembly pilin Flp